MGRCLEFLDLTRRAAEARQWYECPPALLLKLLEQCDKIVATHAELEVSGLPVSIKDKSILATAVQGYKQQLGVDLVLLARALRSRGQHGAVAAELPLLGKCNAEQIAKAAERFSKESWELLKTGATTLPPPAVESATGACKKNIANALGEQEEADQELIQALRLSAKDSYTKGGAGAAATYHEIEAEVPTPCTDLQIDVPLVSEGGEGQGEEGSMPADDFDMLF